MTRNLQSENYTLRQQLETLLVEARRNEDKMRRFDQLERQLIGAGSLTELVRLLLTEYKLAFNVEYVSLTLIDPELESTRILENELAGDAIFTQLTLLRSPDALQVVYGDVSRPGLGLYRPKNHQALFNAPSGAIASVALLPLVRHGALIGGLHLGSSDPDRYVSGCATDFLERLAEIISVCLESSMVRERLKLTGLTDGLTGVQNRRYFEHRLIEEVSQSRRHQYPLACMFLDIDKFKRINDTYGHQTGDSVLKTVASAIQSQLRAGDTISRYGGEEFVVLLPQAARHHAQEIAERIRGVIAELHIQARSGHALEVTISIGLAMLPAITQDGLHGELAEQLVAAADEALYQAKHTGRNKVVCDGSGQAEMPQTPWGRIRLTLSIWAGRLMPFILEPSMGTLRRLART